MNERTIDYEHAGEQLEGFFAVDSTASGPRPGVLVSHAWAGRSEFECDRARDLAGLGYAGFALDLYGKGVLGTDPEENAALMQPFLDDRPFLQSRLIAALDTLRRLAEVDSNKIAAIGYCFGGLCVLDLARIGSDIAGVASFHGLFIPPDNTTGTVIKAKVLALHGQDDPMVPVEAVNALEQELTDAEADWQIHVYGNTSHAFTNPLANDPEMGLQYSELVSKRAWRTLENYLEELFA